MPEPLIKVEERGSSADTTLQDLETDGVLTGEAKDTFIRELEGTDPDIENIKSFSELLKNPLPGSMIEAFKDKSRQNKAYLKSYFMDSIVPNLIPILTSDDVPMEMYFTFRLVMPHRKAVTAAEKIGSIMKENPNLSNFQILSELTGLDIKSRGDLKLILSKLVLYHPHLGAMLSNLMTKFAFK